jgi:hypothetical protein
LFGHLDIDSWDSKRIATEMVGVEDQSFDSILWLKIGQRLAQDPGLETGRT